MTAIASVEDFRDAARRRLPRFLFDYADGGAFAEETLRRNAADLRGLALRQRVLQDVATLDLGTTLFGRNLPLPVVLGPVGIAGMYRRRGEVQAARAAHRHGVPFTLSTVGICAMDELRGGAIAPRIRACPGAARGCAASHRRSASPAGRGTSACAGARINSATWNRCWGVIAG
jgi:hypothetical protein